MLTSSQLKSIPTVGSSGIIGSWIDAFQFVFHAKEIIEEGHRMYGSVFKVPLLDRWTVVVSGAEKINDLRKASVEELASIVMSEDVSMDYTFGRYIRIDPYHLDVVRGALTRNIGTCFADVQDEIKAAFRDNIPITEDWIEIPAYETILQIVCRASNRMFIGLPLCRNRDYIKLNINYTIEIFTFARIINILPTVLKIIGSAIFTPRRRAVAKAEKLLGQTIRERLHQEDVHGRHWPGKPNDLLSWLLDITHGDERRRTVKDLSTRVLSLNTAAIHTTSMTFTTALYALAAHPEYAETLRNEIESVIREEGCTKAAMGKMNQLDSFVKEAQRVYGTMGVFGMQRTTRKDFVFSDGTVVPAGYQIVVAALSTHTDEENYEDPLEFKPWRFSEMRQQEGEGIRHRMATPSLDFVFFGHGRPACPGRFFAVNELKALMSHVLLNFDVKMDKFPEPIWFSDAQRPNESGKVLFRKRVCTP
ncbi:cytochrome P450 [Guyanagaster necrorhizus]|uniref:Cytochrome P450 n=1 Tax=Guyanagaster necrorhizus TaxID=856835 RepID=A0A9P8ARU7_9AGAR|nr:cytochrome P450 [Guyanagaster necrorhizus MCA 3950]KAG7445281.1 cytochrome P450 [Guyanagaster necrorhizus MCA 3950]